MSDNNNVEKKVYKSASVAGQELFEYNEDFELITISKGDNTPRVVNFNDIPLVS